MHLIYGKNSKKILIIEDEEPIADLLAYSLKREGYITQSAKEGVIGLEIASDFLPDMVLLDLMLPDISGFDVCKRIVQKFNIPIVMITAKCDISDKILGIELGADDYITKPFNIKEAMVRINAIFRRIELTAQGEKNSGTGCFLIGKALNCIKRKEK